MIAVTPSTIMPTSSPAEGMDHALTSRYVAPMTTSANSVITAIELERPGLRLGKKQLLLFFAQGHHLATHDEPLFAEPIYATDRGVAVEDAPGASTGAPTDTAQLDSIGYVVERYAALSPADLRTLIQASQPWQAATKPGAGARIEWAHLRDWFRRPDETDDPDDERPNRAESAFAESLWAGRNPD
ncbi:hypothetical protein AMIS_38260 [Actinoplanes missouriensis 431]|uniref:Antitoxin SocA-like Panacea domain-containing protein n=2 Tax=Actinoplanes missouriensis TaxID=1866 RepID=I0H7Q9_ACTM4|nr:hypothetical protein AMIS_38260 [Actinoplanes missouriensis 431]